MEGLIIPILPSILRHSLRIISILRNPSTIFILFQAGPNFINQAVEHCPGAFGGAPIYLCCVNRGFLVFMWSMAAVIVRNGFHGVVTCWDRVAFLDEVQLVEEPILATEVISALILNSIQELTNIFFSVPHFPPRFATRRLEYVIDPE
jgi:hypothetical protein